MFNIKKTSYINSNFDETGRSENVIIIMLLAVVIPFWSPSTN